MAQRPKLVKVQLRFPEDDLARLRAVAAEMGTTLPRLLRDYCLDTLTPPGQQRRAIRPGPPPGTKRPRRTPADSPAPVTPPESEG